MDIKTLLDNLHEEVSCSVCMNIFTEPKQLPCLHSFCLKCLTGIQRTSGRHDIITCPECRRENKVPGCGNLKDLPTNFRINSLLDVLAIKECNTTGVKCGNCDKISVHSFYCFQCCAFWCDECITGHNIIRANKEHRVLALKDFEDQDIENVLKRPVFCRRPGHEKKELEFFCKNCEDTICSSCVATTHDGHVKILLEEAANERKLEVMSAIESRKAKAQKMRNNISKLDESCNKIEVKVANVKRSAQQFAESMIAVIEAKKQEIFDEVEQKAKESLERLGMQKSEMEHKVKMIDTAVEKAETLLKRSTNAEIVQLDKSSTTIFQKENSNEILELDCDLEDVSQLIFVQNETLMVKATAEGIGSLDVQGNHKIQPNDEIPLEEESWFHGRIDRQDVPTLLKKEGDYLVRESPTKLGQVVLSTRSDGLVRHFIFRSDGDLVRFEDQGFPSVRELLSYLVKNKVYVTKESTAILLNPVSKAEKDNFEINRNDIVLHDKQLTSGYFWDLTKGSLQLPVTVKSYKESVSETLKQEFLAEAEILKKFDHPNIVRLIGVCTDRDPFLMVLEFMDGGIFLHYLRKNVTKLDKNKLIKFSIDAAAGMDYLGSNNCIHRDLAARNCLIDTKDLLKISDFRMAKQVDQVYKAPNLKDTPIRWTAPEVLSYSEYTTLSDIWSFGVFLWETFSYGSLPYPELNNKETMDKVVDGYRMPPPADTPPEVYQIMKDCWTFEPEGRPRFYEILKRLKQIQRIL